MSADFGGGKDSSKDPVKEIQSAWASSPEAATVNRELTEHISSGMEGKSVSMEDIERPNKVRITWALLHRLFIKSYRDVVAYGIRIVMYLGRCNPFHHPQANGKLMRAALSILSGTVWLRLSTTQASIQPFINSIVSSMYPLLSFPC